MSIDRRLIAGAFATALLVAACGGSSATASPAGAGSSAGATSAPTTAPTDAPATSSGPDISLAPGNAADLEALIPSKVGNMVLQKTSFDYSSIPWASMTGFFDQGQLDPILKAHGKTAADVRFALGIGTSSGGMPTEVFAFQLRGVPASEFATALDSSIASATMSPLGGKSVYATLEGGFGNATYGHDDVLFMIIGSTADVTSILQALP